MSWLQEGRVSIGEREFAASEVGLALESMRQNENWLKELTAFYSQSHKGLSHWIYLSCLAGISAGISQPIDYVGSPIRGKIHLLLKGQTGGGKGFIMGVIED